MTDKPSVLVAMPAGDMIPTVFASYLLQIMSVSQKATVFANFCLGSVIHTNRNLLVREAFDNDIDYIFFLDTDIVGPPDIIDRLLSHGKDIVGGTYRQRKVPFTLLGNQVDHTDTGPLREMVRLPGGCLLVKTSVFEKMTKPYFEFTWPDGGTETSEDYVFCDKARKLGYKIWMDADVSLKLGHLALQAVLTCRDYENDAVLAATRGE